MVNELPTYTNVMTDCDGLFYCLAKWAYTATEGMFWALMLLGFGVMIFIASQRFGTPRAFGFASIACLFAAIFLATMQLMAWWISSVFIIVGVIGLATLIMNER